MEELNDYNVQFPFLLEENIFMVAINFHLQFSRSLFL